MNTVNERIKELRVSLLSLSQESFGSKIGVSKSSISQIEKGYNQPMAQTVKSICREFGVNEEWLISGIGDVFSEVDSEEELQKLADRVMGDAPGSFRRRLISVMAKLNDDQWKALAEISDMLAKESAERSLAVREKDAEEEYIKKSSGSARRTDISALNSTGRTVATLWRREVSDE